MNEYGSAPAPGMILKALRYTVQPEQMARVAGRAFEMAFGG